MTLDNELFINRSEVLKLLDDFIEYFEEELQNINNKDLDKLLISSKYISFMRVYSRISQLQFYSIKI